MAGKYSLVWTDDDRNNTGWYDNAANTQPGDDEQHVAEPDIVAAQGCESAATSSHDDTGEEYQLSNGSLGV